MRKLLLLALGLVLVLNLFSQDVSIAKDAVKYLASDELEGRFPGTKSDSLSQAYIVDFFKNNSVKPFDFGYIQEFSLTTEILPGDSNKLSINGDELEFMKDFLPINCSAEVDFEGKVVYGGNTIGDFENSFNNKWALLHVQNSDNQILSYRKLISEVMDAKDKNAGGLILVADNYFTDTSEFYPFDYTRSVVTTSLPVIQISKSVFKKYLSNEEFNAKSFKEIDLNIAANTDIEKVKNKTGNVAGWIEGADSEKWLIFGAHYDHLGYGGHASGSRTPERNEIHNGADDNASGVAMVMMLAEYYSEKKPAVNIAFVLFGAEEQGLIGSNYFVEEMPFDAADVKAMINYDMVGRMKDSSITISGTGSAKEFESILDYYNEDPLKLTYGKGAYSGSDQASFYSEGIPVLFFNSGLHDDYHTPEDDIDKINYAGMLLISELAANLSDSIINSQTKLTYRKVSKPEGSRHGGDMKVTLGIMPDVAGKEKNGLGVDGVRPDGPADNAGIKKGDVIVKIKDKNIANIYDYMKTMSDFKKGDTVNVLIERDKEEVEIKVSF